jgi:D-glycero-D-manno-heptose 1,7-bisphosphate phosphatase
MISNIKPAQQDENINLIIFDRDGTLIENVPYLSDVTKIKFKSEVIATLKELQDLGYKMVVATNQSGIGRKLISETEVSYIHEEITKRLYDYGIKLDEFIYCPHLSKNYCSCRKPENGMIEEIIAKKKVDRSSVVLVGDMITDAIAASRSSVKSILVSKDPKLMTSLPSNCDLISDFKQLLLVLNREI